MEILNAQQTDNIIKNNYKSDWLLFLDAFKGMKAGESVLVKNYQDLMKIRASSNYYKMKVSQKKLKNGDYLVVILSGRV